MEARPLAHVQNSERYSTTSAHSVRTGPQTGPQWTKASSGANTLHVNMRALLHAGTEQALELPGSSAESLQRQVAQKQIVHRDSHIYGCSRPRPNASANLRIATL